MKNRKLLITIILALTAIMAYQLLESKQTADQAESQEPTAVQSSESMQKSADQAQLTEPSSEQLTAKSTRPQTQQAQLSKEAQSIRDRLNQELHTLNNCEENQTCPEDNSDPRASSILKSKMLSNLLVQYRNLHIEQDYFDDETTQLTQAFLNNPDGHVQEQAINLMSVQVANSDSAKLLISALETSFDAKIMKQAMTELRRYPELEPEIQTLFSQTLKTGSFYVGQELANNILPFLSEDNIEHYRQLADELPANGVKAKALKSNIHEYQLKRTGG